MRIRSLKPEFWKSDDVTAIPDWGDRLLFIGLWSYVDDNGVGRDNERLITSELFGLEEDAEETRARVHRGLASLADRGLIHRYTSREGRELLFITGWHHQKIDRPSKSPHPLPDPDTDIVSPPPTSDDAVLDEDSRGLDEDSRGLDEDSLRARKDLGIKGSRDRGIEGSRERAGPTLSAVADASVDDPVRDDVEEICTHLADRVASNGSKRPTISKEWRRQARLLLDRDGRTVRQVVNMIDWCQDDDFWRANILSMPTLRAKYDRMKLQAERPPRDALPRSRVARMLEETAGLHDELVAIQEARQRSAVESDHHAQIGK